MKPDADTATVRQILGYVARNPRHWPSFAWMLAEFAAIKVRLHLACWSHGYTIRRVRRMAREDHILS